MMLLSALRPSVPREWDDNRRREQNYCMFSELTEGCKNGPAENLSITKNRISIATVREDINFSLVGDPVGGNKPWWWCLDCSWESSMMPWNIASKEGTFKRGTLCVVSIFPFTLVVILCRHCLLSIDLLILLDCEKLRTSFDSIIRL